MFRKIFDKMTTPTTAATEAELNMVKVAAASVPWTPHMHGGAAMSTINAGMGVAHTITATVPSTPLITSGYASLVSTAAAVGTYTVPSGGYAGSGLMGTTMYGTTAASAPDPNLITLSQAGKEVVRLTKDGEVIWADGVKVDEAAEAFARSLSLGAEVKAGMTTKVKLRMRDSVFEDLIAIAKDKGSLSAEDLTYLLEASKIVERLKGI